MDTLRRFALASPERPAAVIALSDERLTYQELDRSSAALATVLAAKLPAEEVVAVLLNNTLRYFEVCFAARRAGLYYVPVSTHLSPLEIEYILLDSGASILFSEQEFRSGIEKMSPALKARLEVVYVDTGLGETASGSLSYQEILASAENGGPFPDRPLGLDFAYSSGTTGRPKGIKHRAQDDSNMRDAIAGKWLSFFELDERAVYLSTAPLYHAAPLRFAIRCIANGGTSVVMPKFDAEQALKAIQTHKVTHSQWVPTMFVRLCGLPVEVRDRYDLSSQRFVLHAAAPCPVDLKKKMIDWWGPIIWEYYTGSERAGGTLISSQEWLAHPGSVGKAAYGTLHIVDEAGGECPVGVDGLVCFEGGPRFQYHNDPQKTAEAHTPEGWATFGDIGHVDAQGYLYLTDRRANLIISGGVNIYPQEAENVLLSHPMVKDVAVIGVPNPEFGEEVKAVVELHDSSLGTPQLAQQLIQYCRERISHIKCPRSVDFNSGLPRTEAGKLLKRVIRDQYNLAGTLSAHSAKAARS